MYYVLIAIILFLHFICQNYRASQIEKYDKYYSYAICVVLVLMAAFRSDIVGADTAAYRLDYEQLVYYSTFQSLIDRYSINYIGYYGLSKLFYMAHMPVQAWFGFIEAFYLFALMKLVNRFSRDKIFSLIVYTTIGLFTFSMAGEKQTFAASLMMLGFTCFLEKKYLRTIILIVITFYTHQAALMFLAVYPLYCLRKSKLFIPLILLLIGLMFVYGQVFISSMVDILQNEHFQDYLDKDTSSTYVTFIFYSVITVIAFVNFKNFNQFAPEIARFFLGTSLLGCGIQLLAAISPSLFRLALFYTPFMMILLPNTVYYSTGKSKKALQFVLLGCIVFYFLYTGRNTLYSFSF